MSWENEVAVNDYYVSISQPYKLPEYKIVIVPDVYFDEIKKQLVENLNISESLIKPSNYLFKNFKREIIEKYKDSKDKAIIKISDYLQNHELDMFNGQVKNEYLGDMFDAFRNEDKGILEGFFRCR